MDLYLKFESEEQAIPFLYNIIPAKLNEEGEVVEQVQQVPKFRNLDVIGSIYRPTGEVVENEDGISVPVLEKLDGWHVNVRVADEQYQELVPFIVIPKQPSRVWA